MTQLPEGIATWLRNHGIIIELILAALVALAFAMKFLGLTTADDILMITMLALAAFYFVTAFLAGQDSSMGIISSKVFSIASSVCVIGLLFSFLRLPGAKEQLTIGLLSMGACTIIVIYLAVTGRTQKFVPMLIRTIVLGGLSLNAWFGLDNLGVH